VLFSECGIGRGYDVAGIWRERAPRLKAHPVGCGHFLAEERPDEITRELLSFLGT
jgi:haloacetate dehalogenase